MTGLISSVRSKWQIIVMVLVFLLAIVSVVLMLPRERRFSLDYSKGSPWGHDALTANFGFSIQKTAFERQQERDSLEKNIIPYFVYDAFVSANTLPEFKAEFDKKWEDYTLQQFRIDDETKYEENGRYESLRALQNKYHNLLYKQLEQVYLKGIIRIPEVEEFDMSGKPYVNVVRKVSETISLNQINTAKTAYERVMQVLNAELTKDESKQIAQYAAFFSSLEINKYIKENVIFDKKATDLERSEQLKTISGAKGYIQEGELLISRGVIVTSETYQILESYKFEYENQKGNVNNILAWTGRVLLTLIAFMVVFLFLFNFRREVTQSLVKTSFILFMMVLILFIASMVSAYDKKFYYVVPFTILPIIIRTFYDERVALFIHVVTVLLGGFMALNSFDFIFLNIIAGMVAIFSLTNLYHRSRFFLSGFLVVLAYSVTYFGISVVKEGSFSQLELGNFGYFGLNGIFTLLSFLLIYIFEKTFGFLSDTTLMELSDTNQPLLRKLAENAPATFQHSMQVANLSEEATRHIGGNPLLVRTGALYHDIGKSIDASYFTENQMGGVNPHQNKDLKESAKIIINHVIAGKEMAIKHKLPDPIIDFILMHHGTSTAKYFYKTYQNEHPGKEVDKKDFQYPGPRPFSKETAVLMMADSVEAASRSLESYTAETISELVERIVGSQMDEGQFEEADITFRDIKKVKEVFKARLNTIYHARIAYPK